MRMVRKKRPSEPGDVVWDERLKARISLYGRDRGTSERWGHGLVVEVGSERGGGRHAVDVGSHPFDRYHAGRLLGEVNSLRRDEENEGRWEAGKRFLGDWERGCRRPRVIADLGGCVGIGGGRKTGGFEGDWGRWMEAYLAMDPWSSVVQDVVCFDLAARDWALRKHGRIAHPGRVGMMALRLGLGRLVRWYGVVDRGRRGS